MKKSIKKTIVSSAALVTLLSAGMPVMVTMADTYQDSNISKTENITPNQEKLVELLQANSTTSIEKNGDTVVSITDAALQSALYESGFADSPYITAGAGLTKIVWHRAIRYGDFDLYLSKNFISNMKAGSLAAAAVLITWAVPEVGTQIAVSVAGTIMGRYTDNKNGYVYCYRTYKLVKQYRQ